jgi:hypothetical protein
MKKFFIIILIALFLALLVFFSLQFFGKLKSRKGALQVTSVPESKVYINDTYIGQTPLCKCESADMLAIGDYTIRLVPLDKSLSEFQEKITISEAVLTVVDRKFGKDSLSEGSVISLTPLTDKKKLELLIVSFPEGSTVLLDNNTIGTTPLLYPNPTESDHVLKVRKNGYKEKTVRIRPPLGYKLTTAIYLSTVADLGANAQVSSPSIVPSPSLSPVLSPSQSTAKIIILDTPTGFLRVRTNNSIASSEIGRVNPGETYPLISEQGGWFEIKLKNGSNGWISNQYARKQ